jgi:hypothetical protein
LFELHDAVSLYLSLVRNFIGSTELQTTDHVPV